MMSAPRRITTPATAIALALSFLPCPAGAQIQFVEVGAQRGIEPFTMAAWMGGGVAAADFDDDGDIDLFVPNAAGAPDQLYRNLGTGQFEEIAQQAGLASEERSRSALWFDYDGDGRLDLAVATDCCCEETEDCINFTPLRLYHQTADALFVDVTATCGLTENVEFQFNRHRGGLCAGDLNRDGYLDLLVTLWHGPSSLFLNQRDGTFADISVASGVGVATGPHWQPVMADFDGDGWLDIYQAVDFLPNHLWINGHDDTFIDVAQQAGLANAMNDMGVALGDYDNDGDIDLYITNIYRPELNHWNTLFRNDSVGSALAFTEIGPAAGVEQGYWGWGATFLDADNDTRLDLAETNGYFSNPADPARFFRNIGGSPVAFADVSSTVGFDQTDWGSALIAFDYDRDGDLDMLQVTALGGPLRLLENRPTGPGSGNHHLVVKPRILGPNNRAIGAVVRARIGQTHLMRLISAGTSFMGQEPAEAFFGLGPADSVDTLTVDWPDGTHTVLANVPADQVITVTHGGYGDHDADGDIDLVDYRGFLDCRTGPAGQTPTECFALDADGDGHIDAVDFAAFQRAFTGETGQAHAPRPPSAPALHESPRHAARP